MCLCHYGTELLRSWFQTNFGRQLFKNTSRKYFFFPWSGVGRALCPIFMLWLVKMWQVSSCGKFMQHRATCLPWQLKLTEFVSTCDVFNCLFHWTYKMKYSCYQESSVIHSWFVYWVFLWEMHRLWKSEIRFWMASFSFFTLLDPTIKEGSKLSSDSGLTW